MDLGGSFLGPIATQQKMDQSEAMAPLLLAHTAATTRLDNANASQVENRISQEKIASNLMAQRLSAWGQPAADGTPTAPPKISDILLAGAQAEAVAGNPAAAIHSLAGASQAQAHEAQITREQQQQQQVNYTNQTKAMDRGLQVLASVTDADSWERAKTLLSGIPGAKDNPFVQKLANLPYDPDMVSSLNDSLVSAKDRALNQIRLARLAEQEREHAALDADRAVRASTAAAAAQSKIERDSRVAKAGGKDVGAPVTGEVNQATRLIKSMPGMDALSDDDMKTAAFDTAAQARTLRKANPGLSADEAMRQAMLAKQKAGDFSFEGGEAPTTVAGLAIPGTGSKASAVYTPSEPWPRSNSASDLVSGKKYTDPATGQSGIWNGKGWTPIPMKGKTAKKGPSIAARAAATDLPDETTSDE